MQPERRSLSAQAIVSRLARLPREHDAKWLGLLDLWSLVAGLRAAGDNDRRQFRAHALRDWASQPLQAYFCPAKRPASGGPV
jgi:hypothetical protein